MKAKLLELNLTENIVAEILNIFDTYKQTMQRYSKPKGRIEFRDNMKDVESLSKKLKKRLDKLSIFEQQLINPYCHPKIFELKTALIRLSFACQEARKRETRFSRREPFLISLTSDLRDLLDAHGIKVKKYRNNILCRVLDILLDEDEAGISERSFNLVRQVLKS